MILSRERRKTSRAGLRFGCSPTWRLNDGLELVLGCMISGEIVGKMPLKRGVLGGFGRLVACGSALTLRFGGLRCSGILVLLCACMNVLELGRAVV